MTGTPIQLEWAERLRLSAAAEFDRVAGVLQGVASRQSGVNRSDTLAMIAILESKRAEVLGREEAGYFIRVWQETGNQVRQLILEDSRYQAIHAERRSRKSRHSKDVPEHVV